MMLTFNLRRNWWLYSTAIVLNAALILPWPTEGAIISSTL